MTIKITSATFSACIVSKDALPADDLPVVALVGRSNVGKSSLINALTGRKELARTSSTPGKTLTINFYCINDLFYLVDLPGYGYAKASKVTKTRIQGMMNEFFSECKNLKGVVQILDIRHKPSPLDIQMHDWISDQKLNHFAVLTKVDKLSNQQVINMRASILQDIKGVYTMLFSAKTLAGRDDFLDAIEKVIAGLEFKASDLKQKRPVRREQSEDRQQKKGPRTDRPARTEKGPGPARTEKGPGSPRPEKGTGPARPPRPAGANQSAGPNQPPRQNRPERADPSEAPAAGANPAGETEKKQNPPRRENNDRPERSADGKSDAPASNNRRRRWKSKKTGSEPRKDSPKPD